VLSMNAMLEPRMVAASIQRLALALHGASPVADWLTVSSQGSLMKAQAVPVFRDSPG